MHFNLNGLSLSFAVYRPTHVSSVYKANSLPAWVTGIYLRLIQGFQVVSSTTTQYDLQMLPAINTLPNYRAAISTQRYQISHSSHCQPRPLRSAEYAECPQTERLLALGYGADFICYELLAYLPNDGSIWLMHVELLHPANANAVCLSCFGSNFRKPLA